MVLAFLLLLVAQPVNEFPCIYEGRILCNDGKTLLCQPRTASVGRPTMNLNSKVWRTVQDNKTSTWRMEFVAADIDKPTIIVVYITEGNREIEVGTFEIIVSRGHHKLPDIITGVAP